MGINLHINICFNDNREERYSLVTGKQTIIYFVNNFNIIIKIISNNLFDYFRKYNFRLFQQTVWSTVM